MALRRYTRSTDGTIPVQALLYNDEELFTSQDNVGIYDGSQKSMDHQNGTVHITSHRLFYIDSHRPGSRSFEMALSFILKTDYYAGLFKSSPKVTCYLSGDPIASGSADQSSTHPSFDSWECEVCAYRNPPGLSPTAARICSLCGVPRTKPPATSVSSHHLSSSLPVSALSSSTTLAPELQLSAGRNKKPIPCPACTFLNHPYLRSCEICSTDLPSEPKAEHRSAPSSRPLTPDPDDDVDEAAKLIKVSFRKGGDKHFYAVLKRTLKTKAWEETSAGNLSLTAGYSTHVDHGTTLGRTGISGVLRTVATSAKGRETHMQDALQDLEALMVKAKDMVRLAAELNEKLTAAAAAPASAGDSSYGKRLAVSQPEEATFIRSSLSQLGVQISNTPVTLDMMRDEREWFDELARELAGVLQGAPHTRRDDNITVGMMKSRGIIALDEVWGGWNRARGVALIPPATFLQVLPHLSAHTSPAVRHRAFSSGLNVLHTPPYTAAAFAARLSGFLVVSGPQSTLAIAQEEGLTAALIAEMIDAAEQDGGVCRDDSSAAIVGGGSGTGIEIRWWNNIFVGYNWDGQE